MGAYKTQTTGRLVVAPLVVPLMVPLVLMLPLAIPSEVPLDGGGTSVTCAGGTDGSEVMLGELELQVMQQEWRIEGAVASYN